MSQTYANFMTGVRIAQAEADRCLREASETTDSITGFQRMAEYDELMERVDWYLNHAALFAPKTELEIAA